MADGEGDDVVADGADVVGSAEVGAAVVGLAEVGEELGVIVTMALVGPVGVIVAVGPVLADGESLGFVGSPGVVDALSLGVPGVLDSPLVGVVVGVSVGAVGVSVGVSVGVGLSVGVVGRSVGVGEAVGDSDGVSVGDGLTLLVGSGIVVPPELSAGFGIRVVVSDGLGDADGEPVVGVGVGLWVGLAAVGELAGLAVVGAEVGADAVVVGVFVGSVALGDAVVGATVVGLWDDLDGP